MSLRARSSRRLRRVRHFSRRVARPLSSLELLLLVVIAGCAAVAPDVGMTYQVSGDAIPAPLVPAAGDAARGREVLAGRDGNCLLCHAVPEAGARFMGNLGPSLSGVGSRLTAGQLRLRIVDSRRVNPATIMPPYYSTNGLVRVGAAWRGKTLLAAEQVEDVVAYLLTLR